jgi:hypothetical protein
MLIEYKQFHIHSHPHHPMQSLSNSHYRNPNIFSIRKKCSNKQRKINHYFDKQRPAQQKTLKHHRVAESNLFLCCCYCYWYCCCCCILWHSWFVIYTQNETSEITKKEKNIKSKSLAPTNNNCKAIDQWYVLIFVVIRFCYFFCCSLLPPPHTLLCYFLIEQPNKIVRTHKKSINQLFGNENIKKYIMYTIYIHDTRLCEWEKLWKQSIVGSIEPEYIEAWRGDTDGGDKYTHWVRTRVTQMETNGNLLCILAWTGLETKNRCMVQYICSGKKLLNLVLKW